MEFTNRFHVPLPVDEAWKLMLDVPRILPCLPGARLTDVVGKDTYRGSVSVKLGPIKLSFDGQAKLVRTDEANHIAYLQGAGLDPKGRGAAQSEFSFALAPAGAGTDVTVTTQLQLTGAVAQYGRGTGMIAEVAGHILKQFERNLADSLQQGDAAPEAAVPPAATASAADPAPQAPPAPAVQAAAGLPPALPPGQAADAQVLLLQAQALLGQAQAVMAATQQALARFEKANAAARRKPPQELNMLAIGTRALWSQLKQSVSRKS